MRQATSRTVSDYHHNNVGITTTEWQ